jgi:hypothetical protein
MGQVMGIEYIAREPFSVSNHGVQARMAAACDLCVKNSPTPANAGHSWQFSPLPAAHRPTVSLDRRLKMRQAANMCDSTSYGV